MILRTTVQPTTARKTARATFGERAHGGCARLPTRNGTATNRMALCRNAAFQSPCARAWTARAVPHPGQSSPVKWWIGHFGNQTALSGSTVAAATMPMPANKPNPIETANQVPVSGTCNRRATAPQRRRGAPPASVSSLLRHIYSPASSNAAPNIANAHRRLVIAPTTMVTIIHVLALSDAVFAPAKSPAASFLSTLVA